METINRVKALLTLAFSVLSSLLGTLAIPVILLVGCNVIDYITAVIASPRRGQKADSNKGIQGIKKKISMWLLIVVAAVVDYLIKYAGETVGIILPFQFFVACVVAIWLICNEILSILENIGDTGIELPSFLEKIVSYIKSQVEDKADIEGEE